jgi:cobalt/nickel transport system permease protein
MMRLFFDKANSDHFLCRMDARVKIVSTLALLIMVLSYKGVLFPLILSAACLSLCATLKVPFKTLLLRVSEPLFIIFVILFLKIFFSGTEPLFSFDLFGVTITAYRDGLLEGTKIAFRIIGAVTVVFLLGFSTPFTQFMAGLSWMRVPQGFVEVSMFAYRYIFMLSDDAAVIYNAQKNRLGYSTLRRGLNSFGILSGSLVLKAFENSQSIATAMSQRGYDGNMPVSEQRPFRLNETAWSLLFIIFMGLLWQI